MKTVAFDESGHSGENLLDAEQPIYSLASVCLEEDQAEALVSSALHGRQASELKFSSLRKRASGKDVVLDVLRSELWTPETRSVCVSEKRWFLVGKVVDMLLEPLTLNSKVFYESGMHRFATENLFAYASEEVGSGLWDEFLHAFVSTTRKPESAAFERLAQLLGGVKEASVGTITERILRPVPASPDYLSKQLSGGKDALEPSVTSLVLLLESWSSQLGKPFRVVHDDSKVIAQWVEELTAMSSPGIEPFEIKSDVDTFRLPLRSAEIEFRASVDSPAVQLADLVAGAATWWLKDHISGGSDAFAAEIAQTGLCANWAVGSSAFHRLAMTPR